MDDLEEYKGDVDFDFFDSPSTNTNVKSPLPKSRKSSEKLIFKPPPSPVSRSPKDSPRDSLNYDDSGRQSKEERRESEDKRSRDGGNSDLYSSDSETDSSFSDVSSVRSGGRAPDVLRSPSGSRSPSPLHHHDHRSKVPAERKVPKKDQKNSVSQSWTSESENETGSSTEYTSPEPSPRASRHEKQNVKLSSDSHKHSNKHFKKEEFSNSSDGEMEDVSEDRNSSQKTNKSRKYTHDKHLKERPVEIDRRGEGKARPFSAHPRRRNNAKVQAWGEDSSKNVNNRMDNKPDYNKGGNRGSKKHKYDYSDDSVSESESDMTDVSPLTSPRQSPQKTDNRKSSSSSQNSRIVQNGSSGKTVQYREVPDVVDSQRVQKRDERETLDLQVLMSAVSELEKKKRVRENTRRVMFAPPKPHDKDNYTFSNERTKLIERENQRLLREIMKHVAEQREPHQVKSRAPAPVRRVTASAINRSRQQKQIEGENLALLRRLQGVKATSGMSRNEQLTDYHRTVLYGVPVAAADLQYKTGRRSRPWSAGSTMSQRSRSMCSVQSTSTLASTPSTVRSGRRPESAKRINTRPEWSDRW